MASPYTNPESPEWQLPLYLKFLDKTSLTVISITACFLLYTRSSGVAYFTSGVAACIMAVKMVKKLIRQERPVMERPGSKMRKDLRNAEHAFYYWHLLRDIYPSRCGLPSNPSVSTSELDDKNFVIDDRLALGDDDSSIQVMAWTSYSSSSVGWMYIAFLLCLVMVLFLGKRVERIWSKNRAALASSISCMEIEELGGQ
ncbi:hypothetical protein F5880DRAFT_1608874 [Lentinula raphanica]|nr:hypothetical protein F5880DRAFT_1608874 [Lentinula raphanica]